MGLEPGMTTETQLDLESRKESKRSILNLCGFFVTIIDERVYLIPQTAKEFLVQMGDGQGGNDSACWQHSFNLQQSHFIIGFRCMAYLLFDEIDRKLQILEADYHSTFSQRFEILLEDMDAAFFDFPGDLPKGGHHDGGERYAYDLWEFSYHGPPSDDLLPSDFLWAPYQYALTKQQHRLLEYAAQNWIEHFCEAGVKETELTNMALRL